MAALGRDFHVVHQLLFAHFEALLPSMNNYELIVRYAQVQRQPYAQLRAFFGRQDWRTWYSTLPQKLVDAATNAQFTTVKRLFHIGVRPAHIAAQNGIPLFHYLCSCNRVEMVKLFVTKGHALDNMSPEQKLQQVISSVRRNHLQMVNFLVRGCNICVRDPGRSGETALVIAVCFGYVQMAHLLLPHSAQIDQLYGGKTLLHICIGAASDLQKRCDMMRMLLQSHANPQVVDRQGEGPLQLAVRYKSEDMVKTLLEGGAAINHVNIDGETALHVAVNHGFVEMSRLLRKAGAAADVVNLNGETARALAEKWGHHTILEFL